MRRSTSVSFLLAGLAAMALLALTACGPTGPTWVDAGATYHTTNLKSLYAKASIGDLAKTSTANTAKLRHDALVGLRRRGGSAADAADLITKTLPADSHGVPLYVERANVNGVPALILIEAIGPSTGKLTTRRLWALSDQGAVLFVGTR